MLKLHRHNHNRQFMSLDHLFIYDFENVTKRKASNIHGQSINVPIAAWWMQCLSQLRYVIKGIIKTYNLTHSFVKKQYFLSLDWLWLGKHWATRKRKAQPQPSKKFTIQSAFDKKNNNQENVLNRYFIELRLALT